MMIRRRVSVLLRGPMAVSCSTVMRGARPRRLSRPWGLPCVISSRKGEGGRTYKCRVFSCCVGQLWLSYGLLVLRRTTLGPGFGQDAPHRKRLTRTQSSHDHQAATPKATERTGRDLPGGSTTSNMGLG